MDEVSCCFQEECACHECAPTMLEDMDARNWIYRVEGAQNLIFAHKTSAEVLRLANSRRGNENISLATLADHRFVRAVLCQGPLKPYVMFGKLVSVTDAFLDDLKTSSEDLRPHHRSSISSILVPQPLVLLQKDLAKLFSRQETPRQCGTVCVEIKPRGGLTSVSRLCSLALCDAYNKFERPSCALKRCEPIAAEVAASIPEYSSKDFFSGDRDRIRLALEAMRARKASELKVFYEGKVALASDIPIAVEPEVLNLCLTSRVYAENKQDFEAIDGSGSRSARELAYSSSLCRDALEIVADVLAQKEEVLRALLFEQARDFIDIAGGEILWNALIKKQSGCEDRARLMVHQAYMSQKEKPQVCDEICRARKNLSYKDSAEARRLHCDEKAQEAREFVTKMSSDAIARILADFLTAAVVKDCSLMVSLSIRANESDLDPGHDFIRLDDGGICVFAIHVVDIGMKACHRIKVWARREENAPNALTKDLTGDR